MKNTSIIGGDTISQKLIFNETDKVLQLLNKDETNDIESSVIMIPTGITLTSLDGGNRI